MRVMARSFYLISLLSLLPLGCSSPAPPSPAVLIAGIDSGPGAAVLTLRRDGSCEWIPGMFSDMQIGRYRWQDSVLTLSGFEPTGCLKSRTLLLTTHNPNNPDLHDSIFYAVDRHLRGVDNRFIFRVTFQRR